MDLIPVTLLTGFLGSGKTTLLNRLVRHPDLHRTLIIINEFGEIGLDHLLVTNSEEDLIVEMSSGCMCCTIRKDLANTLRDITWRFARDGICQFDRVLIETTGLADPAPILHTLITDTFIAGHYKLDGIITTVDAASGNATLDAHPESVKQIAVADRLLLTKTDVATTDAVAGLQQRLLEINPAAPQISVSNGDLNPASILNLGLFDTTTKSANVQRWLQQEAYTLVSASRAPYRLNYLSRASITTSTATMTAFRHFAMSLTSRLRAMCSEQWIGDADHAQGRKDAARQRTHQRQRRAGSGRDSRRPAHFPSTCISGNVGHRRITVPASFSSRRISSRS